MEVTWIESSDTEDFKKGGTRYERRIVSTLSQKSLTVDQLIYLAGFFDGEGTLGLYYLKRQKAWRPHLRITQNTSKHALRLFNLWAEVFAGKVYRRYEGKVLDFQLWNRPSMMAFIQYVGPYCVGKKQQMILMENWLVARNYSLRTAQTLKALKRV